MQPTPLTASRPATEARVQGGRSAGITSSIGRALRVCGRSAGITSGRPAAGGENKEAAR